MPKDIRAQAARAALITLVFLSMALLFHSIAQNGLVKYPSAQQHAGRFGENSWLAVSEDKDGCLEMRSLGRHSNGVYMSIQPCKPVRKRKSAVAS